MSQARFILPMTILAVLFIAPQVRASWAQPPDVVWGDSADGKFAYRKDNIEGEISVYTAADQTTVLWSAKIEGYHPVFSKIFLVKDGTALIHIRGNHQVHKLDDVAISVYRSTGKAEHHLARDYVDEISKPAEGAIRVSAMPNQYWLKSATVTEKEQLLIVTHLGKTITLDI